MRNSGATPAVSGGKDHSSSDYQKSNEIVTNSSCPLAFETFDDAAEWLGPLLLKALLDQGYVKPTPIQAQTWPIVARGQDMVGIAKTGSGKTLGYLLPAFVRVIKQGPAPKPKRLGEYESEKARPSCLVVAPTRELVQQIAIEAEKFAPVCKARNVALYGGVSKGDNVRALREGVDVLIATPGRLLDLAKGNEKLNRYPPVTLTAVSYLVLDEGDKMLDMGFEEDVRKIVSQCKTVGARQTLFFSATWPKTVRFAAASLTKADAVHVRIGQDADQLTANKSVVQVVYVVEEKDKLKQLEKVLKSELKAGETALVFAATKAACDLLEEKLQPLLGQNVWCAAIHKGKEQSTRDANLNKFRELTARSNGQQGVLIATDIASRGLDIPGVAIVVVYHFAYDKSGDFAVKNHVHRIGRTGRAGKVGRAFTFITPQEDGARELADLLQAAGQDVPAALLKLAAKPKPKKDTTWVKGHRLKKRGL